MNDPDKIICKMARILFNIESLRDAQLTACQNLLLGCNVAIIDKTGFGKSLVMNVVALLFGGMTLHLVPMIALGADQASNLEATLCSELDGMRIRILHLDLMSEEGRKELLVKEINPIVESMILLAPSFKRAREL
jgi:superfamily II DNA helicase RecQ